MMFIPEEIIEEEAEYLLNEYGRAVSPIMIPPIPVDEICESHLGLTLDFDDLQSQYGPNVLAVMYVLSKRVVVDESLVPEDNPRQEGRFNFTLGHEIGHWILHREKAMKAKNTPDLFGAISDFVVCRSDAKDPIEYEADVFSSCLLMPAGMVRQVWRNLGHNGCQNVYEEIQEKRALFGTARDGREPIAGCVREMASVFHVSQRAMQIRLKTLGLLDIKRPSPQLTFNF